MKTNVTTKKLKLVYSFNGKFRRRSPGNKLRYTGGETRIVSVDPTTLTYSELRSLITERVNTNSDEFTLKYRLPGAESVGGGDSPLVLLASDDDVFCMVEEFEAYYGKKSTCINNNSVRIWVYVCTNDDYDYDYDDKISGNDGHVVGFSEKSSDFGCGFRVFGRNIVDSLKGNNLGFKKLPDNNHHNHNNNHNHNHNHNVGGRSYGSKKKGSGNEQDSLRKSVLKQQLMLARQRDQIHGLGRSLGPNYKVPDHDHGDKLLIDLGNDRCRMVSTNQVVCDQGSGDRNLSVEKKDGDSVSCGQEIGSKMGVQCLNEEIKNVLPLDSGVFCGDQAVGGGTVVNCVNTGYESHCGMVRLSENPALSSAVKCCTGQEARSSISQQGQAMRLYREKAISPKLDMGDNVTQGDVQAVQSLQMYNSDAVELPAPLEEPSLIDFGDEPKVVVYEEYCVNGSDTTINYQPNSHDASISTIYMVPKVVDNAMSEADPEITKQIVMVPTSNCTATSMDLSSDNPALLSSSKMATPKSSHVSPEGLDMFQLTLVDSTVEAKLDNVTDGSNRKAASDSVEATPAKWDQSCTLQQDMQDDSSGSTDVDEKVIIRTSLKYSNMADGVPSDLAAFYTHLATKELQTIRDSDLEYVKELGSGNYGTVYHGKWRGSDVAVKKIKPSCFNGEAKEEDRLVADFWKEAHMLSQLHHPNIVAFYGVVTDGPITNLATVTEYMINGSLKQVLQRKDRTIDRRKRLILAMDAAFGMEYLHEKNIVHFDLKSHNFLVNMRDPHRPVCKIGDLGLSKIKQRTMVSGGVRGTIPWMAPELLNISTKLVSEKVDVYSFGIVMWELLTGEEPYADMRSGEIIAGIIKGTLRPEIPSWCDPAWRSLMESCWSSDPESRPSFSEIAKELRAIATSMNIK